MGETQPFELRHFTRIGFDQHTLLHQHIGTYVRRHHIERCRFHLLSMVECIHTILANGSRFNRQRRKPRMGIVRAKSQTILCPRREHPVWFGNTLQREIINHHRNIAVGAVHGRHGSVEQFASSAQPGHQSLCRSLFISRCAIDLTRAI